MGFNYEQYEMYDNDNWNNADGVSYTPEELKQKYELDFLRKKYAELSLDIDKKVGVADEKKSEQISSSGDKFLGMPKKSGVGVAIGAGVLVIGVIAFLLIRKK